MTSAELVAALREQLRLYITDPDLARLVLATADFIERDEALRRTLPCPTCGGTGHGREHWDDNLGNVAIECADCDGDGFMSWERIVAIVAAVFDDLDSHQHAALDCCRYTLRSVRP